MATLKLNYPFLKETKTVFAVKKYSSGERMGTDSSTAVYGGAFFDRLTLHKDLSPLLAVSFKKNHICSNIMEKEL